MTHNEIKAIIDGGDYCIKLLSEHIGDHRWAAFEKHICERSGKKASRIGFPSTKEEATCRLTRYWSPTNFSDGDSMSGDTESKTVLTLDEWWSVMGDDNGTTAWQPKEGEMVEVGDDIDGAMRVWHQRKYMGKFGSWYLLEHPTTGAPIGWKHIRPIQTIPVSLDDLKSAYAEKHNIDVNKITVT